MRIRFVHQYFHPDQSSVSRVISRIAFDLAAHGADVRVVCSRNRYDRFGHDALKAREAVHGVDIRRVWGPSFGRGSLPGRILDMGSFCLLGTLSALFSRRADAVVLLTNPPFHAIVGALLKRIKGERFIHVLMDLYPDVAVRAGLIREASIPGRLLRRIGRAVYAAADAVVVLGDDMREAAVKAGADPERIVVIRNWADPASLRPVPPQENPLRRAWGLEGKFVVAYSGNLGVSHGFDEILDVAESLSGNDLVRFLFIGGGKRHREVAQAVAARRLSNVMLKPYQSEKALSESLSVGDVHYVSLLPGFEGLVVPSKSYGIMAVGRPIVYQGDARGEIARMVVREGIGHVVAPGDRSALRDRILELASDPEGRERMGAAARAALESRYSEAEGLAAYRRLLAVGP